MYRIPPQVLHILLIAAPSKIGTLYWQGYPVPWVSPSVEGGRA